MGPSIGNAGALARMDPGEREELKKFCQKRLRASADQEAAQTLRLIRDVEEAEALSASQQREAAAAAFSNLSPPERMIAQLRAEKQERSHRLDYETSPAFIGKQLAKTAVMLGAMVVALIVGLASGSTNIAVFLPIAAAVFILLAWRN